MEASVQQIARCQIVFSPIPRCFPSGFGSAPSGFGGGVLQPLLSAVSDGGLTPGPPGTASEVFCRRRVGRRPGAKAHQVMLTLTFTEALLGCLKSVELPLGSRSQRLEVRPLCARCPLPHPITTHTGFYSHSLPLNGGWASDSGSVPRFFWLSRMHCVTGLLNFGLKLVYTILISFMIVFSFEIVLPFEIGCLPSHVMAIFVHQLPFSSVSWAELLSSLASDDQIKKSKPPNMQENMMQFPVLRFASYSSIFLKILELTMPTAVAGARGKEPGSLVASRQTSHNVARDHLGWPSSKPLATKFPTTLTWSCKNPFGLSIETITNRLWPSGSRPESRYSTRS